MSNDLSVALAQTEGSLYTQLVVAVLGRSFRLCLSTKRSEGLRILCNTGLWILTPIRSRNPNMCSVYLI